jgi:hypothetical protein
VSTKYVLWYQSADDVAEHAPVHYPAHAEWMQPFIANGTLLMIGPFADPQSEGSMALFTTREAAEEFVEGDPFVKNGVVKFWTIREWNEALAD